MSKAILILNEMPKRCGDCPLLQQWYDDEYKKRFDMCFWRYCKIEDTEGKLNVCPLKPMPERINPLKVDSSNLLDLGYLHGRNDLINEMEGEVE